MDDVMLQMLFDLMEQIEIPGDCDVQKKIIHIFTVTCFHNFSLLCVELTLKTDILSQDCVCSPTSSLFFGSKPTFKGWFRIVSLAQFISFNIADTDKKQTIYRVDRLNIDPIYIVYPEKWSLLNKQKETEGNK